MVCGIGEQESREKGAAFRNRSIRGAIWCVALCIGWASGARPSARRLEAAVSLANNEDSKILLRYLPAFPQHIDVPYVCSLCEQTPRIAGI